MQGSARRTRSSIGAVLVEVEEVEEAMAAMARSIILEMPRPNTSGFRTSVSYSRSGVRASAAVRRRRP